MLASRLRVGAWPNRTVSSYPRFGDLRWSHAELEVLLGGHVRFDGSGCVSDHFASLAPHSAARPQKAASDRSSPQCEVTRLASTFPQSSSSGREQRLRFQFPAIWRPDRRRLPQFARTLNRSPMPVRRQLSFHAIVRADCGDSCWGAVLTRGSGGNGDATFVVGVPFHGGPDMLGRIPTI